MTPDDPRAAQPADAPYPLPPFPLPLPAGAADADGPRDVLAATPPAAVTLTGGGGVVGRHVRALLADRDIHLLGRCRLVTGPRETWRALDLAAGPFALTAPTGSMLCQLASRPGPGPANLALTWHTVAAVNACQQISRVVLVSTAAVYGERAAGTITEATPCQPTDPAARAMLACERVWRRSLRPDCELVVLRPGTVTVAGHPADAHDPGEATGPGAALGPAGGGAAGRPGGGLARVRFPVDVWTVAAAVRFALDAAMTSRSVIFNVVDEDPPEPAAAGRGAPAGEGGPARQPGDAGPAAVARAALARLGTLLPAPLDRLAGRLPAPLSPAPAVLAVRARISTTALRSAGFIRPLPGR